MWLRGGKNLILFIKGIILDILCNSNKSLNEDILQLFKCILYTEVPSYTCQLLKKKGEFYKFELIQIDEALVIQEF